MSDESASGGVRRLVGLDRERAADYRPMPGDRLSFCDLRGVDLSRAGLRGARFFGCRLEGTSFRLADLRGSVFTGCFAPGDHGGVDLAGSDTQECEGATSHLRGTIPGELEGSWPAEIVSAATGTMSDGNELRHEAVAALGRAGFAPVAPLLACALADPEWDVRLRAVNALLELRGSDGFGQDDREMLEWMFERLADEHSLVRQAARDAVERIAPGEELLHRVLARMYARGERTSALGAAAELAPDLPVLAARIGRAAAADFDAVGPDARRYIMQLAALGDESELRTLLARALDDADALVRATALREARDLDGGAPAEWIERGVADPDEEVRLEAIYAASEREVPGAAGLLARMRSDPSQRVRDAAVALAAQADEEPDR